MTHSLRDYADVAEAAARLAVARALIAAFPPSAYLGPGEDSAGRRDGPDQIERMQRAIDRAARRVPWRSDCLVQAVAARRWLAARGIFGILRIGTRPGGEFNAHAWLTVGDLVVVGGDIADHVELRRPRPRNDRTAGRAGGAR